jgi:5,10-methylenetetrahydromethanopterin reductase
VSVSVVLPFGARRPEQAVPYAGLVQWGGAARLWQGQSVFIEPHQAFAFLAAAGHRIPIGTAVTIMGFRHPLQAAMDAASLAATMGAPVVAGFGPGAAVLQAGLTGRPYPSPLTACREYLAIVRGLLDGEVVRHTGEYFSLHGSLPPSPGSTGPPVELGLGVLRPGMARLAGELADVAITWLTPPAYLAEWIVPALRESAAVAGRPAPRLVTMVPVAVSAPDRDPADLALAGHHAHLSLPHYRAMLRRAGIPIDPADPVAGARALVDSGVFVSGEPHVIAKELRAYREVGVDEIVLNVTGVWQRHGTRQALSELGTVLEALS